MADVDVWQFSESLGSTRDGLSARERAVAAICDLRQEVNSGGAMPTDAARAVGDLRPAWDLR